MGDFETVKDAADLKEYARQFLKPGRERGKYVCPVCGSGTGPKKTAALSVTADGKRWTCFGSCGGKGGDIFDLAGILNNADTRAEQLRIVADWAGVSLSDGESGGGGFKNSKVAKQITAEATAKAAGESAEPAAEYAEGREKHRRYVAECARRLADEPTADLLAYLESRGITHAEAVQIGLGYDPHAPQGWQDAAGEWRNGARLVIPWAGCDYYHVDRAMDDEAADRKYVKPKADEVGQQPTWNPAAFDEPYLIAVEGALDAIAIQLCGYNAVALGGTGGDAFATEAAARHYPGVIVEMLDADGHSAKEPAKNRKGRGAGADLIDLLEKAGIKTLARAEYGIGERDTYSGHKDAGECLAADRADLMQMLEYMRQCAADKARSVKDAEYRDAMKHFSVKDPAGVAADVLELRGVYEPVSTGISSLDGVLGGGVSLGELTIFGAISSYGKTTLAVQIADHMAANGRPVLFVTIEQSAREIVAKSLSRLVYTMNAAGWNIATPNEITSLRARREWAEGLTVSLSGAVDEYARTIAPNLRILEGSRQPTAADVRAVAATMADYSGQAPIIFIDYLQLLAPLSERFDSDKRNTDANVTELRKMARDMNTHVWAISSLNRSSYSGVISLDAFKESGMIEYSADNLLGLQPHKMAEDLADVSEGKIKREADRIIKANKAKPERDCELVILKQRNGALPDEPLPLTFKPMSAYFYEPKGGTAKPERIVI